MIRSTKTTLSFTNKSKLYFLYFFLDEYKKVMSDFVDILWEMEKVPTKLPKEITDKVETWLSARAIQCAGKQASGVVRGTRQKQKQRLYIINKLNQEGKYKQARKLQRKYDSIKLSKPKIDRIEAELDSRFVKIDLENETSFDGWITLGSLGNNLKIHLPFKKHKHFNKMMESGKLKQGIRISRNEITFILEVPDVPKIETGIVLGIDIGEKTTLACSSAQMITEDADGHTYQSICDKLSRKKRGSKGFRRVSRHRTNFINYTVKQLNLQGVKQVNHESIKNLKVYRHWNYAELFTQLDAKLEESGVQIKQVCPTYTSQRCSCCGWVRKKNRNGKKFKCDKCSYECDADLNAAVNISLPLKGISRKQRLRRDNRTGFYWLTEGQEHIVPATKECFS